MSAEPKHAHNKPRLGRGLAALISTTDSAAADDRTYQHVTGMPPIHAPSPPDQPAAQSRPQEIPLDDIAPNPYQPRRQFRPDELAELTASIAAQGILQPIIVARAADGQGQDQKPYVLIAGERRLRAGRAAGLSAVPCVVRQATQQQMLEWALVENIHRADLNPIERADAYREYLDRFNLTQAQAAEQLGQPRATVANYLRLLDLHDYVKGMISDGTLSFGHAKLLAGLAGDQARQLRLARRVVKTAMSVRQLEAALALALADPASGLAQSAAEGRARTAGRKPPYLRDLEDRLTRTLGTRVAIQPGRAKNTGRVVIDYYSLDDFDRITEALGLQEDQDYAAPDRGDV